jgi:hypothetical protein
VPEAAEGAEGNERLTAMTGAVLLAGFAAEGITILAIGRLLTLHVFLGMLLIGPVLLKICSTGYRFIRYYTGAAAYVRKGPPAPLLRLLGPVVIVTSLTVLGSGIAIVTAGPQPWLLVHKASFVLWLGAMTIHVLAYVWRLPRILLRSTDGRARAVARGQLGRWLLVTGALAGGLLLALLTMHIAASWQARPGQPTAVTAGSPGAP